MSRNNESHAESGPVDDAPPQEDDGREERTLAKPIEQAGVLREPGETVRLRPDQIARLEPEGYFKNPAGAGKTRRTKAETRPEEEGPTP